MKTRYMIAAAALLVLAGCAKEVEELGPEYTSLRAVIETETKVSFDAAGKFSWDEGDKIAVYVGNAFEEVSITDPLTGAFRVEGTGDRSFYAVYPYTAAPANNAALTVTLPDSYDISSITDDDYAPVPMVAKNLQGQDELYFLHVGALVRIFCKTDAPASSAVVTFDKDVTGTYTVDTSNESNPTITTGGTDSNNSVTFTLPSGSTEFVLNVPVPCGTYETVSVAIDGGTPVQLNTTDLTFERRHGKTLMMGDFTFEYKIEGLHDVVASYLGGAKELAQAFYSYKTDGTVKVGVPFGFEFSETGEDGTWTTTPPAWLSIPAGVDYSGSTTGKPLKVSITPQEDSAVDHHAEELASRTPRTDFDLSTLNVATGQTVASSTANCYVVDRPGSYKFPLVYGNALKDGGPNEDAWHARNGIGGNYWLESVPQTEEENIVYRSGSYYELVPDSSPAYSNDMVGLLGYMVDHRDRPITSPYIKTQLANAGDVVTSYAAVALRSDVTPTDVVQNVRLDDSGDYILFDVPAETIRQSNTIIALMADDTVNVWSWHIWVTDKDLKAIDVPDSPTSGNSYSFCPANLGWRDTRDITRYDERSWYIRVMQNENDGITSRALKVISEAGTIVVELGGRSLLYQNGRKDPFLGTFFKQTGNAAPVGTTSSFYSYPGVSYISARVNIPELYDVEWEYPYPDRLPEGAPTTQHGYVHWDDPLLNGTQDLILTRGFTVGLSIRYPRVSFGGSRSGNWLYRFWRNLWNSSNNSTTSSSDASTVLSSTKTIYDPCPVGYKVPVYDAFRGITTSNTEYAVVEGVEGRMYGGNLFFPFTPHTSDKFVYARYSNCSHSSSAYIPKWNIIPDYIVGSYTESNAIESIIRPVKD